MRLRPGLLPVRRAGLRARYPVPDLRRPGLPGVQAERLGRAAAVRPGASERAAHGRHRPRAVERLRVRPRADAPGDDALRHRRHPPACRAAICDSCDNSEVHSSEVLVQLVQRTRRRARLPRPPSCSSADHHEDGRERRRRTRRRRCSTRRAPRACESVEPIEGSKNVKAVVDDGPVRHAKPWCAARRTAGQASSRRTCRRVRRSAARRSARRSSRRRERRHARERRRTRASIAITTGILELRLAPGASLPAACPTTSSRSTTSRSHTGPICGAITAWRARWPRSPAQTLARSRAIWRCCPQGAAGDRRRDRRSRALARGTARSCSRT